MCVRTNRFVPCANWPAVRTQQEGSDMSPQKKIVIIGAGPTGLGAAYRLKELGYTNFHMYERSDHLGGLASSFTDSAGFTWDIGGHVMFSHYKYYDKCFDDLMGSDFQMNNRECWLRMFNTWVPYPFQNNICYLPKEVTYECLTGLIEAQTKRDHKSATNFKEFIEAVFGDGICKHFMTPYNFKVWAHPAEMMNKEWIGERVAVIDINRAIKNVVMGSDDFGWGPNNQFKFPLFGGTGEFYRRFGKPLAGHYTLNKKVDFINMTKKEVRFSDGEIVKYDELITAMPLDKLCNDVINGEDRKDIVDTWVYHADYSYPTPSVERDGILTKVIPYLEQHGIYSRGRFGMWKYEVSNTDHTLMQGVELINRLLLDEPEQTIGIKYESTLDGRNAAKHERSTLAGSGDPKRVVPASPVAPKSSPDAAPASAHPGQA